MKNINPSSELTVGEMYETWKDDVNLVLVAGGAGLGKKIEVNKVQKLGLRMVETDIELEHGKIQVLGNSELSYFDKLSEPAKGMLAEVLTHQNVPCYIISKNITPPKELIDTCEQEGMPVFATEEHTGRLIGFLNSRLEERLAPFVTAHGLLMDIHGIGVLILGPSGIGKSESALDLILRGSKLVADDVVIVRKIGDKLVGDSPETIRYLMEVRGVGIINVKDMFGRASVLARREVELVVELVDWNDESEEFDRTGLSQKSFELIGVHLPYTMLPVQLGRNMATIIEVAVRNEILKSSGHSAGEQLEQIFESSEEENT